MMLDTDPFGTQTRPQVSGAPGGSAVPRTPLSPLSGGAQPRQQAPTPQVPGRVYFPPDPNNPNGPLTPNPTTPAPAPTPSLNFDWLRGYDPGKLQDTSHNSVKYQLGRTFAGFDPKQGITPALLSALNGLNLGTFSGSGDTLSLSNPTSPEWGGLSGSADVISNFTGDGSAFWEPFYIGPEPTAAAPDLTGLLSAFSSAQPNVAPSQQDMSWLAPILSMIAQPSQAAPAPQMDMSFLAPLLAQQQGSDVPVISGDAPTPLLDPQSGGDVGTAMRLLAMQAPDLRPTPTAQDPLTAAIARLVGGGV